MQKYWETVLDRNGNVVVGATVTVTVYPAGTSATVYASDVVGSNVNPLTTDSNGYFEFWAANGRYSLAIAKTGITSRTISNILIQDSVVSITEYGAIGDDSTDNTTAIQAALTANAGGTVCVPTGTFRTGTLSMPANTTIQGGGVGSVLKIKNGANASLLSNATNAGGLRVLDLVIDGNKANQSGTSHGINFVGGGSGERYLVRGCVFQNVLSNAVTLHTLSYGVVQGNQFNSVASAVAVVVGTDCVITGNNLQSTTGIGFSLGNGGAPGAGTFSQRCVISNNTINLVTNDGIYIDLNSKYNVVSGNVINAAGRYGIICDQSPDNIIIGNWIISPTGYGIFITNFVNATDGEASRNHIIGNKIKASPVEGILVQGSAGTLTGVLIQGNHIYACLSGIHVTKTNQAVIEGNCIELSQQHGLWLDTCSYGRVQGNSVYNSGQTATNTYAQIELNSVDHTLVSGNNTNDTSATKARTGIQEQSSSDNNLILGNQVYGAVTAGVAIVGASTIVRDNVGFVTENSGTATIASGTTSIATNHGLSATPVSKNIMLTPANNPTNDPGDWWVSGISSTQITISCRTDPGAGGFNVNWRASLVGG